jgi:hypothetical protein
VNNQGLFHVSCFMFHCNKSEPPLSQRLVLRPMTSSIAPTKACMEGPMRYRTHQELFPATVLDRAGFANIGRSSAAGRTWNQ